jgi:hypothetical protein
MRNVPVHVHNCENRHVHGHHMDNERHGHGCRHERGNSCGRLHGCGREDGLRHERGRKCGRGCGCAHGHECGVDFYIGMDLLYMYKKVADGVKLCRYFTAKDVLWDINEINKNRERSYAWYHSREADTLGIQRGILGIFGDLSEFLKFPANSDGCKKIPVEFRLSTELNSILKSEADK